MTRFLKVLGFVLVAAAVLGACGGGDSSPEVSSESPDPTSGAAGSGNNSEGAREFVSPDGLLIVSAPQDGTEVAIAEVEASLDPGIVADAFGAYELGPAGATFDPPLQLTLSISDTDVERGIAVMHVKSSGEAESVVTRRIDGGVSFELSSFSAVEIYQLGDGITLSAPDRVDVGETFEVTIHSRDGGRSAYPADAPGFTSSAPIEISGSSYVCGQRGEGSIEHHGELRLTQGGVQGLFFAYQYFQVDYVHPVTCVLPPVKVPPTDIRCVERATGLDTTGCPIEDVLNIRFRLADGELAVTLADSEGWDTTVFVGQGGPDIRFWEFNTTGDRAFIGGALNPMTPDETRAGPFLIAEDARLTLDGLEVVRGADGQLEVTLPGGMANGLVVDEASGPFIDFTVFVEKDGIQGIYFFDPTIAFVDLSDSSAD